ncbi:MAG: hypothetical protein SOX26_02205 [Phocaeicola sp.]|nr:hypothetical protein [Phocaeicola sp.]
MARIGYIVTDLPGQHIEEDNLKIQKENCDIIYRERYNREGKSTELRKLIDNLNSGDEVVFLSMANAFKGARQMCLFLNIARIKNLILIFLRDRIDSHEEKYERSTEKLFNAVATLAEDSYTIRKLKRHPGNRETTRSRVKRLRNEKCVELYKAGVPTEDIKKQVGFRSKSSVFRILKESGVQADRRRNNEE